MARGESCLYRECIHNTFIASALEKCEQFVMVAVLPDLLGKWYSQEPIRKPESADLENDEDQAGGTWYR